MVVVLFPFLRIFQQNRLFLDDGQEGELHVTPLFVLFRGND